MRSSPVKYSSSSSSGFMSVWLQVAVSRNIDRKNNLSHGPPPPDRTFNEQLKYRVIEFFFVEYGGGGRRTDGVRPRLVQICLQRNESSTCMQLAGSRLGAPRCAAGADPDWDPDECDRFRPLWPRVTCARPISPGWGPRGNGLDLGAHLSRLPEKGVEYFFRGGLFAMSIFRAHVRLSMEQQIADSGQKFHAQYPF